MKNCVLNIVTWFVTKFCIKLIALMVMDILRIFKEAVKTLDIKIIQKGHYKVNRQRIEF